MTGHEPTRAPAALVAAAALLVTGLAAACTAPDGGTVGSPRDGGAGSDPVGLVGMWRVSGAEGEGPDTWLRLDAGRYMLWGGCDGYVEGGWEAAGRAFVASDPYGAVAACGADGIREVPWLRAVVAYEPAGEGWRLLDADGDVVAGLRVDGAPAPIPDAAEHDARAPEVTDDVRAAFDDPAPLPDGLAPAAVRDVVGRWEPSGSFATDPHVVFHEDGTWSGSDGCNGAGGAWALDDGGRLLATAGPQTLMACDGAGVPGAVSGAARAASDGGRLVLLDADGTEIVRLVRG
ncbi:META domain-containing protein [Cellulosimicrobium cellulans]|uniref:META domain-containing protein n=1 Tax=Cellulosimicrobium cellulans TaxID=1710 RepID=UPI001966AED2|nr:META domain-containing protein [Cellulosimicrobium cellulans]MBN0041822.1 META domain-containing protein [Cellulosimicrobium cellulans]